MAESRQPLLPTAFAENSASFAEGGDQNTAVRWFSDLLPGRDPLLIEPLANGLP